ncbi:MAG: protein-L-isoaspartate O-methyltransferase [Hyphomicrobiales bacterium]|nr:MAG: protein-L-isoaspartate O-methyltransferase [Hyphomicrobiales bacterium]
MTADFQDLRVRMVDGQLRTTDVTDDAILSAMLEIPREEFVPARRRPLAYIDEDIEIARGRPGRFLMRASPFAKLVQLAGVRPGDLVLDIGCGPGYSSAVLARIAGFVVALESDSALAGEAGSRLAALGCENVSVIEGPLPAGHAAQAPYDVILIEGAVDEVPAALTEQLKDGGRLVAVVGEGNSGRATLWLKEDGLVSSRPAFNAAVRPLDAFKRVPVFEF